MTTRTFKGFWSLCVLSIIFATVSAHIGRTSLTNSSIKVEQNVRSSNGRTDLVQWDGYSLFVHGQRIFLWSGEFHTWRLPVPELWLDVLQKIKALGMNAISVYVHWGLVNPAPGQFDFDHYRALEPLFKMAMQVGLWIVLRPGPYINAETTGGGIPHWVTSTVTSHLRTNGTSYQAAWEPYIEKVNAISAPWQITRGGPIIAVQMENEYVNRDDVGFPGKVEMMVQLKEAFLRGGIDVPLTINDAYMGKNYLNGSGAGDIYGFDSYPQNFDCEHPEKWNPVVTNYWNFHKDANPGQPLYIPEFQGGAFDAWGPGAPGYGACKQLTGPGFESVFDLNLWANNAKMINIYMIYGGTSWGHLPFPGVYTSYDYGAAISENRDISSQKYAELKRQGLFIRSTPSFYQTDVIGNSSRSGTADKAPVIIDNKDVFGTLLRNPKTETEFYVVRHMDSTSQANASFRLNITRPSGLRRSSSKTIQIPIVCPAIQLQGRQSKVIIANMNFERPVAASDDESSQIEREDQTVLGQPDASQSNRHDLPDLLYATASIFFSGWTRGRHVVVFYGDSGQEHEFAMKLQGMNGRLDTRHASVRTESLGEEDLLAGYTILNVLPGMKGLLPLWESSEQVVIYADTEQTASLWAPVLEDGDNKADGKSFEYATLSSQESGPSTFPAFWSIGTNESIIVGGPHLVRSASYSTESRRLDLVGDLAMDQDTFLTVIALPKYTTSITWNGQFVETFAPSNLDGATSPGVIKIPLRQARSAASSLTSNAFKPPILDDWEYADSLPEISSTYDDSKWMTANNKTTHLPYPPLFGESVLYGCDYGFCEGIVIWRGHFYGAGSERSVRLVINGGEGFAASVYINDVLIRTTYGNSTNNKNIVSETDEVYVFPEWSVVPGRDNVVTIIQDNMGLDETHNKWQTDGSRSPRGIRGYKLSDGMFSHWKVQGKVGGYLGYRDKLRGIFNEGGLHAEREGWHLPASDLTAHELKALDQQQWMKRDPLEGLPSTSRFATQSDHALGLPHHRGMIDPHGCSGVGFFRTSFTLSMPAEHDVMMSVVFEDIGSTALPPYRALLFINGWMMGKRVGNLGPQTKFPVHKGILNHKGSNTIAVALWAMDSFVPIHTRIVLVTDTVYDSGFEAMLVGRASLR
ncbi:hypothetical protein FRB95_009626 [Tulasnella sp. JGI-2019a]|nr:hypothetical protein FRB95_009626 [Tulasnella sp. JGI-2019a]